MLPHSCTKSLWKTAQRQVTRGTWFRRSLRDHSVLPLDLFHGQTQRILFFQVGSLSGYGLKGCERKLSVASESDVQPCDAYCLLVRIGSVCCWLLICFHTMLPPNPHDWLGINKGLPGHLTTHCPNYAKQKCYESKGCMKVNVPRNLKKKNLGADKVALHRRITAYKTCLPKHSGIKILKVTLEELSIFFFSFLQRMNKT